MNSSMLNASLINLRATIQAYESALTALSSGVMSYTIDTGQSRQTVTRYDISSLTRSLDSLYNRCATMEARLNGCGRVNVRPCF